MMISKELLIARPDHSFREEVENKFFPPILVSVLYVVLLVSDKYEPIVIYALPVGFYLILWVFSLVHYELYYGLILTKDRIIWPKDNIKLESIASFLVNSSGELEVLSMYHLEDKKVNLKKFNISDVHSIVKVLKTKKEIKIDGQKPEDFWSKSFVDLF
ncbi:MAG: hypothetical protein ABJH98_19915 [Reichenbachiella sp.]|uniref:hypothetical protein n=1 Tax=Reichenbachiella sp. TaxID=2184521 RepID=UPI003299B138